MSDEDLAVFAERGIEGFAEGDRERVLAGLAADPDGAAAAAALYLATRGGEQGLRLAGEGPARRRGPLFWSGAGVWSVAACLAAAMGVSLVAGPREEAFIPGPGPNTETPPVLLPEGSELPPLERPVLGMTRQERLSVLATSLAVVVFIPVVGAYLSRSRRVRAG